MKSKGEGANPGGWPDKIRIYNLDLALLAAGAEWRSEGKSDLQSQKSRGRQSRQAPAIIWTSEITSAASIALGDRANENDGAAASRQPTGSPFYSP